MVHRAVKYCKIPEVPVVDSSFQNGIAIHG